MRWVEKWTFAEERCLASPALGFVKAYVSVFAAGESATCPHKTCHELLLARIVAHQVITACFVRSQAGSSVSSSKG